MSEPQGPVVLRPEFAPFVFMPVMTVGLVMLVLAALVVVVAPFLAIPGLQLWAFLGLVVPIVLVFVQRSAAWSKERCEIHRSRIVHHHGGILSSGSTELELRNITQLGTVRPWVESRLFGTARVEVRAAGSLATEVKIPAQKEAEELFQFITLRMTENGFELGRDRLVQEARPGVSGIVVDLLPRLLSALFVLVILAVQAVFLLAAAIGASQMDPFEALLHIPSLASQDEVALASDGLLQESVSGAQLLRAWVALQAVFALGSLLALASLVLRVLNLRRRRYWLYGDRIDFEDGFLTRRLSMIPTENLADVQSEAPLLMRIVDHANVTMSSQGAGSAIRFELVPDAARFKRNVERLIEETPTVSERLAMREAQALEASHSAADAKEGSGAAGTVGEGPAERPAAGVDAGPEVADPAQRGSAGPSGGASVRPSRAAPVPESGPEIVLSPDFRRLVLVPPLITGCLVASPGVLLLLLHMVSPALRAELESPVPAFLALLALGAAIGAVIFVSLLVTWMITRYTIGRRAMRSRVALLQERVTEFSIEKITMLSVQRSLLDRWMGTATVVFTSVGSLMPLTFTSIPLSQSQEGMLLRRIGAPTQPPDQVIRARHTLPRYLLASPFWPLLFAVAVVALLLGVFLLELPAGLAALSLGGLVFLAAVGFFWTGVAARRRKLELSPDGVTLRWGILGRHLACGAFGDLRHVDSFRHALVEGGALVLHFGGPGRIVAPMLDDPFALHDTVDGRLCEGSSEDAGVLREARPLARTVLLRVGLWGLILFPLAPVLLPLAVLLALRMRRTRFTLDGHRVLTHARLLWQQRGSVVLSRVDHTTVHRGPLHQLFGNGTVSVFTSGSMGADVVLRDVPEPQAFSEAIREASGAEGPR